MQNSALERILDALEEMCSNDGLALTLKFEQHGAGYTYTMDGPDPESCSDPEQRWSMVQKCLARSALFHLALSLSTGLPRNRFHVVRPTGELSQEEVDLLGELTGWLDRTVLEHPEQLEQALIRIRGLTEPTRVRELSQVRERIRRLTNSG